MNNKKRYIDKFSIKEVLVLLIITAVVSLTAGFVVAKRILKDNYTNYSPSVNDNLKVFIDNYNYILNNYYGKYDEEKLLDSALSGVLEALGDPHTVYIDENSTTNFNIQLQGNYIGLGIEIYGGSECIIVSQVFENSPAYQSGVENGDCILKINGEDATKMSANDFSTIIKTTDTGKFILTIKRDEETKEITVGKSNVIINSVQSSIYYKNEKKIGYLKISIFADNTYSQFKTELEKLETENIDSLIIDVRDNTGGHLTSVENILGLFLDSSHIIYKMEDASGVKEYYSDGNETKKYPIIILTNKNSASASEILTATLKEEYGAKSIGEKTYGKGSAQELRKLPDGTQYKITTHKWLTPKGNSIDGIGVAVDEEIVLNDNYKENPILENDNQLQTAIDLLGQ